MVFQKRGELGERRRSVERGRERNEPAGTGLQSSHKAIVWTSGESLLNLQLNLGIANGCEGEFQAGIGEDGHLLCARSTIAESEDGLQYDAIESIPIAFVEKFLASDIEE